MSRSIAPLEGKYRGPKASRPTTAIQRPTHPFTRTVSEWWVPAQDRLTEILGRGWWKTSLRAKPSKEELQSRCHHPLSTQSSMKWPTKRAVTQPSQKEPPPKSRASQEDPRDHNRKSRALPRLKLKELTQ